MNGTFYLFFSSYQPCVFYQKIKEGVLASYFSLALHGSYSILILALVSPEGPLGISDASCSIVVNRATASSRFLCCVL